MKKAVIFHGMPAEHEYQGNESELHWIPWLKEKLEDNGFQVFAPELPKPYEPCYESWLKVFQELPFSLDQETVLIGHSCGAGFFVRFLSENDVKTGPVFLIGPWLDPHSHLKDDFFHFSLERNLVAKTRGITVFVSLDDGEDVLESVRHLTKNIPGIVLRQFSDKGHFTESDMKSTEFPELFKAIKASGILEE